MIEAVVKEPLKEIAANVDRAVKLVTEARKEIKRANDAQQDKEKVSRTNLTGN